MYSTQRNCINYNMQENRYLWDKYTDYSPPLRTHTYCILHKKASRARGKDASILL